MAQKHSTRKDWSENESMQSIRISQIKAKNLKGFGENGKRSAKKHYTKKRRQHIASLSKEEFEMDYLN